MIGAEALKKMLSEINLEDEREKLREDLKKSGQKVSAATDKLADALTAVQADLRRF